MKRLAQLACILVAMLALVSCEQRNTQNVNPVNEFVGTYDFQATGNVDLYVGATKIYSIPLNENGSFTIKPANEPNEVMVIGYNDTIYATVAGSYLLFESTTTNMEYGGVNLQLTFVYGKAKMEDGQLSWHTDVIGSAYYNALTASGTGEVDVTATKK